MSIGFGRVDRCGVQYRRFRIEIDVPSFCRRCDSDCGVYADTLYPVQFDAKV